MIARWLRGSSDAAVRRQAHRWMARMLGEDAVRHRGAFERWRDADQRHALAFQRLERQWGTAAMISQTAAGRARALPDRRPRQPSLLPNFAVAFAVFVAVIGLGVWFVGSTTVVPSRRAAPAQVASAVGEIRTLHLPDGSVVTLDTDSAVRVAFRPELRRIILLRGRARFDVAHDAERPFVVAAGAGEVIARGTLFDVSLSDGHVSVTLLRGSVDVRDHVPTTDPQPSAVHLKPGEATSFGRTEPITLPQPVRSPDAEWVSGMLSFDADRLGDAIAMANRYSRTKIVVADPALNELRISGAYHVRDTAAFARALAASFDLRANTTPAGDILLSRRPD